MKLVLVFVLILTLMLGCQKQKTDYRQKFVGNYTFIYTTKFDSYIPPIGSDTTIDTIEGQIDLNTDNPHQLTINFSNIFLHPFIYTDNSLEGGGEGHFIDENKLTFVMPSETYYANGSNLWKHSYSFVAYRK